MFFHVRYEWFPVNYNINQIKESKIYIEKDDRRSPDKRESIQSNFKNRSTMASSKASVRFLSPAISPNSEKEKKVSDIRFMNQLLGMYANLETHVIGRLKINMKVWSLPALLELWRPRLGIKGRGTPNHYTFVGIYLLPKKEALWNWMCSNGLRLQ